MGLFSVVIWMLRCVHFKVNSHVPPPIKLHSYCLDHRKGQNHGLQPGGRTLVDHIWAWCEKFLLQLVQKISYRLRRLIEKCPQCGRLCLHPTCLSRGLEPLRRRCQGTWAGDFPDPPPTSSLPRDERAEQSEGVQRDTTHIPACHQVQWAPHWCFHFPQFPTVHRGLNVLNGNFRK